MNFSIQVKNSTGGEPWTENFNEDHVQTQAEAEEWAKNTLEYFNRTCGPGEPRREIISVTIGEGSAPEKHHWLKVNLVTLSDHRGMFDKVRCPKCGAEARRYGLTRIARGKKWKAAKWENCPASNP